MSIVSASSPADRLIRCPGSNASRARARGFGDELGRMTAGDVSASQLEPIACARLRPRRVDGRGDLREDGARIVEAEPQLVCACDLRLQDERVVSNY